MSFHYVPVMHPFVKYTPLSWISVLPEPMWEHTVLIFLASSSKHWVPLAFFPSPFSVHFPSCGEDHISSVTNYMLNILKAVSPAWTAPQSSRPLYMCTEHFNLDVPQYHKASTGNLSSPSHQTLSYLAFLSEEKASLSPSHPRMECVKCRVEKVNSMEMGSALIELRI